MNAIFIESGSTYTNCLGQSGGAIYLMGASAITIGNASFINNTGQEGGALYIYYSSALTGTTSINMNIFSSIFNSNYGTGNGGAFYISQDELTSGSSLNINSIVLFTNLTAFNNSAVLTSVSTTSMSNSI